MKDLSKNMIEEILVNTKEINKRLIYPSNMPIQVIYKKYLQNGVCNS